MKSAVAILFACLSFAACCAEPAAPQDGKMSVERVMLAGAKGQKICIQMFAFEMKEQRLTLDASAKETAELSKLDTNKPCKVFVGEDEAHSTVILRVEQNGKTFYKRPEKNE